MQYFHYRLSIEEIDHFQVKPNTICMWEKKFEISSRFIRARRLNDDGKVLRRDGKVLNKNNKKISHRIGRLMKEQIQFSSPTI